MTGGYYVYLISSLPMLRFGARPPFPFEKFLALCERFIPPEDLDTLKCVQLSVDADVRAAHPALARWFSFETALRNELVRLRAPHRHAEAAKYLRAEAGEGFSLAHAALAAHRKVSPLEAERFLDEVRWNFLEELAAGHYFDLDILILYALKIGILERWERIETAPGRALLEAALQI